jgi:hypothetical protein
MTAILLIGGILMMVVLSSNSDRYSTRYDDYDRPYPPPPYYAAPMPPPHYDPMQAYYYRAERSRQSLGYTALFIVLIFVALFYFGGNSTDNKAPNQDTYNSTRTLKSNR